MNISVELYFPGGELRTLLPCDVHRGYVDGLNDPEVNRYLDGVRRTLQTTESVTDFVQVNLDSTNGVLWGIWESGHDAHCGTVRLHSIDSYHKTAQIGVCIFDKLTWGKRIGSKAVAAVTEWGLRDFGLRWIEAGAYEQNISSQKAFLSAGYQWEFDLLEKYLFEGKPANVKVFAAKSAKN
ncbi:MAG: GNAT family N-acetyltransferase [Pseudohongiella sp.]|nr:GNAT family N-acetyltransferase [Pseudohongiella sp.]